MTVYLNGARTTSSGTPIVPPTATFTESDHDSVRQLVHFLDEEGPGHGFSSGAARVITGGLFPTDVTWWTEDPINSSAKKILKKTIDRTNPSAPTPIVWTIYSNDGTTVLQQLRDDVVYSGITEIQRVRTVLV